MTFWNLFWVIIPIFIALTIGYYFGRNQKSYKDYFLGGSQLPWFALALSIVATETSTLTFIGKNSGYNKQNRNKPPHS